MFFDNWMNVHGHFVMSQACWCRRLKRYIMGWNSYEVLLNAGHIRSRIIPVAGDGLELSTTARDALLNALWWQWRDVWAMVNVTPCAGHWMPWATQQCQKLTKLDHEKKSDSSFNGHWQRGQSPRKVERYGKVNVQEKLWQWRGDVTWRKNH